MKTLNLISSINGKVDLHLLLLFMFLFLGLFGDVFVAFIPSLINSNVGFGINLFLRGFCILPIIFMTLKHYSNAKIHVLMGVMLSIFVISYFIHYFLSNHDRRDLNKFLISFMWCIKTFVYVFFLLFLKNVKNQQSVTKVIIAFILIYVFFQFIGAIFGIDQLRSYDSGYRAGYKGVLFAQNEASVYFFFGGLILNHKPKKNKLLDYFLLMVSVFSLILTGTKTAIIMVPILVFYFFYIRKGLKKSIFLVLIAIIIIFLLILFLYYKSPFFNSAIDLSIRYFKHKANERGMGFLYVLTSSRSAVCIDAFSWGWQNMPASLFWGGVPIAYKFVEMDVFDQIFVFGIPATVIYYLLVFNYWGKKSKISFFSFIIIALFAGHAVSSIVSAPFVAWAFLNNSKKTVCE